MRCLHKLLSIYSVDTYRRLSGQLIFKHIQIKKYQKNKKKPLNSIRFLILCVNNGIKIKT